VLANQYRAFAGASGGQVDAGRRAVKPFSKRPTLDVLTTTWVLTKRIVRSHMSFSRWFIPLAQVLVLSLIMLSVYIEIGSDTKNQQLARFGFLFLSPFLFLLSPLGVVHDRMGKLLFKKSIRFNEGQPRQSLRSASPSNPRPAMPCTTLSRTMPQPP